MTRGGVHELLEARARELARPLPVEPEVGEQLDVLAFRMDGARHGVEARHVLEVVPLREPTPLPAPRFVLGLVNHRGRALPVLDLASVLGTSGGAHAEVVVVAVADQRFGIAIEEVEGVTQCEAARVGEAERFVRRVDGEPLALLDLEGLVADGRLVVDDRNGNSGGQG
ncbi:MAG TPA: chemotaxis protein CheW [Solirubrobacteraceae bacterium]|nr:chemotaxis protein CheW [Solirubrobacteraceae bacterium]